MIRQLLRSAAAITLVALGASSVQAQTKSIGMCSTDGYVCFGASMTLVGSSLTLQLQNQGSVAPLDFYSQITGFGLFEAPGDASTPSFTLGAIDYFNGTSFVPVPNQFTLAAGAVPGLNTPNSGPQFTFGDDGLTPCGFNMTSGDNVDLTTCDATGQFLRVQFSNVMNVSSIDALQLAVRFQSVSEANGAPGSYKCYSALGGGQQDCTLIPGGGISGQVVPEPSTYMLLGSGLLGLAGIARRRRQG